MFNDYPIQIMTQRIDLPDKFVNFLITLPENGMGYQLVKVFLKKGNVLHNLKVINSSMLIVEQNIKLKKGDIEKIELE